MAIILPAILEQTKESFEDKAFAIMRIPGVEKIHVDFADGKFVPNKMLDISAMEVLNPAFEWEAHLMVENPQQILDYQIAGFKKIIVHYEAFPSLDKLEQIVAKIIDRGLTASIAINPSTPVAKLIALANLTKHFTLMSVVPGFQGAPFVAETHHRLHELRKALPDAILEVDGAVKLPNAADLAKAGADLLVVGSGLWVSGDPGGQFLKLQAAVT